MTAGPAGPVLEMSGVRKHYGGLRPLRLQHLVIGAGERIALSGLDAASSAVLADLVAGATLPDEGEVRVLGRSTADISGEDDWLAFLDGVGLLSARAVLLGESTVLQNVAMAFTLSIDPVAEDVAAAAASLAHEVGIAADRFDGPLGAGPSDLTARVHLARAIAARPALLLVEHPAAMLPADEVPAFAADLARVAERRALAVIAVTEDNRLARALGGRRLRLQAATGALVEDRGWLARWLPAAGRR